MKLSESVEHVVSNESFALSGFYDRLFERYPEFEPFFSESNLQRQTAMLTMALIGVKQYPVLNAPARSYLEVVGSRHRSRGIPRELYDKFVEVLVEVVGEFHGDQWSESLQTQWTDALNLAVSMMHQGEEGE